ncbi:hypothetical protein BLNAU_5837 [Blattamonas nauphoetae]|uniref:Uncharacterized protein n=1 Tax=Blattamonas nauphoetae TaxID=2049346 RepID=A0ABQ9Y6F4_9EUKA|nr:hypothetical protein BLNAU_5837 [Blattamonas nauphoetae]
MRPKIGTQPTESEDEPTQPETEEKSTLQAIPASKPKFDENFLSSSESRLPCNALDMVELELTRQAYFVPDVDAPSLAGHPLSTSPPSAPQTNQHKHELPQRVLARLQTLPPGASGEELLCEAGREEGQPIVSSGSIAARLPLSRPLPLPPVHQMQLPPQVTSLDTQIAQIPQSYSLHSSSQPTQQGRVSLTLEELEANLRQKPAGFSGMDGYGGRSQ